MYKNSTTLQVESPGRRKFIERLRTTCRDGTFFAKAIDLPCFAASHPPRLILPTFSSMHTICSLWETPQDPNRDTYDLCMMLFASSTGALKTHL